MAEQALADGEAHPRGEAVPVDVDLTDPDIFVDGVPLEEFARLRRVAPVFWHEHGKGDGFWVVTRHADVEEVSRRADVFSSWQSGTLLHTALEHDEGQATDEDIEATRLLMLNQDPPQHTELRHIVQRGFTPRVISRMEDSLRSSTADILDRALAKGEGDFVTDVAAELPLQAICELMGIPQEDRELIFDLSNRLIGFDDPEYQTTPEDGEIASAEMYAYANQLAEARREEPRDDIVTKLISAELEEGSLSIEEFDLFFVLLSVAGNETTRNAISHGMLALFDHPEQWELFKQERPLETTADEIIRWGTPVMQFMRTATEDYELSDTRIREGDRVAIYYSSANRDPEVIEDPNTFDITRDPNPHLAFGGGGPHFCLGANLAKLEIKVMFDMLADRIPNIEHIADERRLRSMFIDGIKELPVRYRP